MKLEFPNETHKDRYEKLIEDWWKVEDLDNMSPWALFNWDNYEEFLEITNEYKTNGRSWVNSDLYFLMDELNNIVWSIQLRHTIWNSILKEIWGHIWYWIAPEFRRKWYAGKALKLILVKAKEFWLNKILITAEVDNIPSIKVIEKNGWVFERVSNKKEFEEHWIFNRYWINL